MGETQRIRCTVQVPKLPSTCGRSAVAIVQYNREEGLDAVPAGCVWTGHAVCDQHDHGRYTTLTARATTTLHEAAIWDPTARRAMSDPTPQTHPELFSDDDIMVEVRYLQRLNKRYGSNALRTMAYIDLLKVVAERREAARS